MKQTVAVGCDPNASDLKQAIMDHLVTLGFEPVDFGSSDPIYARTAVAVAESVARGDHTRGILLCGTGIGVSLAANKVKGAYAAVCSDPYSVERSRMSNDANILCLGSLVVGSELAKTLVTTWMAAEYTPGGRSQPKVDAIRAYESEHLR